MTVRARIALATLVAGSTLLAAACVHGAPSIEGAAPIPEGPSTRWTPTKSVMEAAAADAQRVTPSTVPTRQLTLADVVDLALRNSPATRLSWTQARAAADVYGSTGGKRFPLLSAGASVTRTRTIATPGRPAGERSQYGPSLSLAYTVLDFGGRSGTIDVARQTAIAADLSHNATVENTILAVETAAFAYLSTRAQRDAQKSAVELATAALDVASERHRVGLATIADVLQALDAAVAGVG